MDWPVTFWDPLALTGSAGFAGSVEPSMAARSCVRRPYSFEVPDVLKCTPLPYPCGFPKMRVRVFGQGYNPRNPLVKHRHGIQPGTQCQASRFVQAN